MSDIFVSYASADRERAKVVAEALAARGLTVWWDRNIPPGRQFDEVIEEALDAARCVVVLWSQTSTASTWVKTEAAEALRGKSLVPAIIEEGVRIPLEFRRLQAADLSRWRGDPTDPQLLQFFESVEAELRRSGESGTPPAARAEAPAVAATPRPPAPPPPAPVAPASRVEPGPGRKLSPVAIGAIAAVVVLLIGGGLYYERSASIAAASIAAREKAAAEQAEREKTAAEKAAVERAVAEKAAAEKAAAEKAAAEKAEREAAQRKAEETAKAKAPVPQRQAQSQGPAQSQGAVSAQGQGVPAAGVLNLKWRDSALGFAGTLTWSPSSAVLRVSVIDLRTGTPIGNYAVPALIDRQGAMDYVVTAEFAVPGDSTTPGPHTHTSRLFVQAQQDGSLHFRQNCPRPGECY